MRRRRVNAVMLVVSRLGAWRSASSGWRGYSATLLYEGARRAARLAVHADDAAAGRRRRPANAIVGSVLMAAPARCIGTPIGILAGTYLAEYGRRGWLAPATRFINDILLSAPSIVIGLFVYSVYVAQVQAFLRLGRRARAGADRDPGGGAHHRRHAEARAQQPARGGRRARRADWKMIMLVSLPRGARRHRHRHAARGRAHQRRNRAAALHRAEQPVLVART